MKLKDLKDGYLLEEKIHQFQMEQSDENFDALLSVLRDSTVWIPCQSVKEDDQTITFRPDILTSEDDELFFPVFSSIEAMAGQYENQFECKEFHFFEAMSMAMDIDINGVVVNPFSEPFEIQKEYYETVLTTPSLIEDEDYLDPAMLALNMGAEAYALNSQEGFKEAERQYLYAAKLYNAQAMCNLGYVYTYGRVDQADKEKGLHYFQMAADRDNMEAMMKVADAYRYGDIYPKDERRALETYNSIYHFCRDTKILSDWPEILLRMGECYYYGIGEDIDYGEALYFLNLASQYFQAKEDEIFYYPSQTQKASNLAYKAYDILIHNFTFKTIHDFVFRKFYRKVIYVNTSIDPDYEGLLCIGYVDHDLGMLFQGLCACTFSESKQVFGAVCDPKTVLKWKDIQDCGFLEMDFRIELSVSEKYQHLIQKAMDITRPKESSLDILRYSNDLDPFRDIEYPDDVEVILFDNKAAEKVMARLEKIEPDHIQATLLTEPETSFGVHELDPIAVIMTEDEDGNSLLASEVMDRNLN